jgi:phytoene/squalene synthetase
MMSPAASTDDPVARARSALLAPGHPLALTLPYADPGARDALVSIHAIISAIASVPAEVSDADVARRKLGWWQQALAERLPHPAIQAWCASGAVDRTPAGAFDPLIEAVSAEIEPPRFENAESFVAHCRRVAAPAALLEASVVDASFDPDSEIAVVLTDMAGAGYRTRVVRDLVVDARQHRWMVPLDAQAEHRITRQEVAAGEGGLRLQALVRDLAGNAAIDIERATATMSGPDAWLYRHALLRHHLDRRLGRALVQRPGRVAVERATTGRIRDAVAIWRLARRLRRSAKNS